MYSTMQRKRESLPAFFHQTAVTSLIKQEQIVLVSGETGCGTFPRSLIATDIIIRSPNYDGNICTITTHLFLTLIVYDRQNNASTTVSS